MAKYTVNDSSDEDLSLQPEGIPVAFFDSDLPESKDLAREIARKLNAFDEVLAALKGMLADSTCTCAIGHPDNCPLEIAERAVEEAEAANV